MATCHGTYQVVAAAVITEVGIRGRHVNASDYIKGLQSECVEANCDRPAVVQATVFKLCSPLILIFHPSFP